jgi:hypothetical protein
MKNSSGDRDLGKTGFYRGTTTLLSFIELPMDAGGREQSSP